MTDLNSILLEEEEDEDEDPHALKSSPLCCHQITFLPLKFYFFCLPPAQMPAFCNPKSCLGRAVVSQKTGNVASGWELSSGREGPDKAQFVPCKGLERCGGRPLACMTRCGYALVGTQHLFLGLLSMMAIGSCSSKITTAWFGSIHLL